MSVAERRGAPIPGRCGAPVNPSIGARPGPPVGTAWPGRVIGQDVLGDDAIFMSAEIYLNDLHQKDKAKQYYEQLVIDYPGSTYVQTARQKLQELNNASAP